MLSCDMLSCIAFYHESFLTSCTFKNIQIFKWNPKTPFTPFMLNSFLFRSAIYNSFPCSNIINEQQPELFAQTYNGHNHAHILYALGLHCSLGFFNHIPDTVDEVTAYDLFGYALLNSTVCMILFHKNSVIECSLLIYF